MAANAETAPAELETAREALRAGDFGLARRLLLALRRQVREPGERAAVEAELERLRPDWVAGLLLGICLVLFVVVVAITAGRY